MPMIADETRRRLGVADRGLVRPVPSGSAQRPSLR